MGLETLAVNSGSKSNLFDLKVDLVFYDLTSSYVEGGADWSELLKRGYLWDKRGDCKQIVIALLVTEAGFPVTFRVFEGNRLDKQTLEEMVNDLKGHVLLAVWSYLLYKTLETLMEKKGLDLPAHRALNAIKEVRAVEVALREKAVWKLMKIPREAQEVFEAVGINNLKGRFNQWAENAPPYHYQPRFIRKHEQPDQP